MIIPLRLYRYLARHVLLSFLTALGIIFSVVFILELLNVMKETSSSQSIGFPVIMQLTILKIPATLEQVSHFAVLIGGMISLVKLTKTSELIIARASGVSVWQFLLPGIVSIYLVGVFFTTVFNPISAAMLSRYEQLEARKIKGKTSTLSVSPSGLWLKQINTENPEKSEEIIHALRISQRDMLLYDVIVFMFDANGNFTKRVDAETAKLDGNKWIFKNLLITSPSSSSERMDMAELPTTFSLEQIQGSFAPRYTFFLETWKLHIYSGKYWFFSNSSPHALALDFIPLFHVLRNVTYCRCVFFATHQRKIHGHSGYMWHFKRLRYLLSF